MRLLLYFYCDRNFGDDCMVQHFIETFPKHDITILSSGTEYAKSFSHYPNVTIAQWGFSRKDMKHFYGQYDYMIYIGGSILHFSSKKELFWSAFQAFKFLLLRLSGCKILMLGANLNQPFTGGLLQRITVKTYIKQLCLLTVRDKFTFDSIRTITTTDKIFYYPDIVFDSLMKIPPNPKSPNFVLGISAFGTDKNLLSHLAEVCNLHCRENSTNIVRIFAFDTGLENDVVSAVEIKRMCSYQKQVEIVEYDGDTQSFIQKITQCHTFIPIRFHSIVLCCAYSIPFVPIIYAQKSLNLLNDIGYNQDIYYTNKISNETNLYKSLCSAKPVLEKNIDEYRKEASHHFGILRQKLFWR